MEANTVLVTRVGGISSKPPKEPAGEATVVADKSQVFDLTSSLRSGLTSLSKSILGIAEKAIPPKPKKPFDRSKFVPVDNSIPIVTTNGSGGMRVPQELPTFDVQVFRLVILAVAAIGFAFYLAESDFGFTELSNEGKLHLLAPTEKGPTMTTEQFGAQMLLVKAAFERDNVSDWMEAQNLLVKMAEAHPDNTEARELLCLAHKQLWPYAYQDAEDLQVLTYMAQTTRSLNPSSRHGRTCELIRTWLTGKFQEAKSLLEALIQEFPHISFYIWLKTDMLIAEGDFINGQGFASSLITIWPEFIQGKLLSVHASIGNGRFQEARERLAEILKLNHSHKVAKLMLGEIEFRNFQKEDRAWELLISGIKSPELAPRQTEVMAYTTLAYLSEKRGDLASARSYAEKGFSLSPTNEVLRQMVKKLGGSDRNFSEAARTNELVALGDQYVRSGDCLAAQAQYRAAFDLNPQHPEAAVKAARCLYKVNQFFHAFDYLKRAIKSNPEYFPAYTLLADYYSQKYDFASAMGILNQARAYSTEAYEIYKGYALVELRKNNFAGALGYVSRAIQIYSTDPETFVIKAKAHLGNGQAKESYTAAQKAIEIDPLNVEAQIAYGLALAAQQGENNGIEYFRKLSSENRYVIEYKLAWASLLRDLDRFNESLPLYEEIIAIDPKNKKAQMGLGDSLNGIGKVEQALSAFLLAATFDPSDPEPIMKSGLLYLDSGRVGPAISQFERVLLINKNYPKAYYFIGRAALVNGDFKKALDSAMAERRANPNMVDSYLLAAEIYKETKKYSQCTTEFQQAIKLQPQGAENYVKLAFCYRGLGSYDVAQSMLDIAAQKESGYAPTYRELGALYHVRGEKEEAYRAYEKYLALSPNAPDKNNIEALMSQLSLR
jgi:tetratricopeptide (TPR) repeat protein